MNMLNVCYLMSLFLPILQLNNLGYERIRPKKRICLLFVYLKDS